MPDNTLVKATQLTRFYSGHCAVNAVSFELARGDVLGFLGPNGAGKSTTMQMLTGNLAPSVGEILINGTDLLDHPKQAKQDIGYLAEQPPVYRELTVNEYLDYCARLNRIPRAQRGAAIDQAKDRCGLGDSGKRLIGNLSKGYRQRVGIAQAIIHTPAVVILDEPTVGLDPIQIREIRDLICELGQDHGIILSTHILPEVTATCNRVQIINHGELVYSDSIDSLTARMASQYLLARFGNAPDAAQLTAIAGVDSVQPTIEGELQIHFDGDSPAEAIIEAAVSNGWRLQSIAPQQQSLEQIFIDLTCSDAPVESEDAA